MRYVKLSILMLAVVSLVALAAGCGSSNKESGVSGTGAVSGFTNVGDDLCVQCHSAVLDPLTNQGIVAEYDQNSPHKDSPYANNGNGCEACHGGGSQHNGVGPIPFVNPFDGNGTRCTACHAGKYATNAPTKFATSAHGEMAIETGGSCRRCHTHEGAVLGAFSGLTGSGAVMDNATYQLAVPPQTEFGVFECGTCHQHGGGLRNVMARDGSGNVVNWNPSKSYQNNDQFNLCTGCHSIKSYDGNAILASGNVITYGTTTVQTQKVGHHETSWYRVIGTTHLNYSDNTASGSNGITGYVIRIPKTADDAYANTTNPNAKPCFDCHGHEWKTNTSKSNELVTSGSRSYLPENETIWTEWAKSGHAGQLLAVKESTIGGGSSNAAMVDTAMTTAVTDSTAAAWNHYDWSNGTVGSNNRQSCQRCHTATGASNYLNGPATYDKTKNDFQHLAGWTTSKPSSSQRELLYCWGCHANVEADKGGLRNPGALSADYKFTNQVSGVTDTAVFPTADSSDVCIACHQGQASGASVTAIATSATVTWGNVSFVNSHYMAVAGVMYNKIGFTAFTDPSSTIGSSTTTYGASVTSCDDTTASGCISSTHRRLGTAAIIGDHGITADKTQLTSGGPCVVCHMTKIGTNDRHHTLAIDDGYPFTNVCVNCHDSELDTALTVDNYMDAFVDPQGEAFMDAVTLAISILHNNYNIDYDSANYPYFFPVGAAHVRANGVVDWTLGGALTNEEPMRLMGACFNINLLNREPAAFAHARTYSRRLIYDTIDFLDDKTINLSSGATALAASADPASPVFGLYGKGTTAFTDSTLTAFAPGTTEAMVYLLRWSRSTGAWSSPERP